MTRFKVLSIKDGYDDTAYVVVDLRTNDIVDGSQRGIRAHADMLAAAFNGPPPDISNTDHDIEEAASRHLSGE